MPLAVNHWSGPPSEVDCTSAPCRWTTVGTGDWALQENGLLEPENPGGNAGNVPVVSISMQFGLGDAQWRVGSTAYRLGPVRSFTHFTSTFFPFWASKVPPGEFRTNPRGAPVTASFAWPPYPHTVVVSPMLGGRICCLNWDMLIMY